LKVALSYDATIPNLITAKFAGIEQAQDGSAASMLKPVAGLVVFLTIMKMTQPVHFLPVNRKAHDVTRPNANTLGFCI
jgi:hypothetical protein